MHVLYIVCGIYKANYTSVMQRNLYGKGRKKHPLKRVIDSSRREVVLDSPRKKSKSRSSSGPSSSSLDQALILTSSRPNSREINAKSLKSISAVSTSRFYEPPKTLFEKKYEQNLSKFLPTGSDSEFQVLLDLPLEGNDIEKQEELGQLNKKPRSENTGKVEIGNASDRFEGKDAPESEMEIEMSTQLLSLLCTEKPESADFHIAMLVRISDFFIKKAYSTVLDANDIQGTKTYYTYIKTALKSLLMLATRYNTRLNLDLELVVYLNIASLYFFETDNLDLADTYINRAISIANRNSLTKIAVTSELLYCQILEVSDPNLLQAFLSEKYSSYMKKNMTSIADLFALLRSTHVIVTSSTIGHVLLQSLSLQPDVQPNIKLLSSLYQADLHLYRGSPETAQELLHKMDPLKADAPAQFLAMCYLVQLSTYVQSNQIKKGKEFLQDVSDFITTQRKNDWPDWNEDGSVRMFLRQGETEIPFALQGLNSDEFVIMFYFLSGILFLSERSSFKKANKVFTTCLEIIELQLEELTQARPGARNFSLRLLTGKIVRLNYVRYSVYYYRIWVSFMEKNDFTGIKFLQQFINDFDVENFTKEELSYYKLLIPRFLYLTAIYFQATGDLAASKYYFTRVRQLCSSENTSKASHKISYLQRGLGIGCESMTPIDGNSELYMFATLHLLQITEYEIHSWSDSEKPQTKSNLGFSRNQLGDLYLDLSQALDTSTKTSSFKSFASFNLMFKLSFKVLSCIYLHQGFTNNSSHRDSTMMAEFEDLLKESPPRELISVLGTFVLYNMSLNLEHRKELLSLCLGRISDQDDNSKILMILLLREAISKKSEMDDLEERQLLQMKVQALEHSVQDKLARLQFGFKVNINSSTSA